MGCSFTLVNHTRKEQVNFEKFSGSRRGEILGHPVAGAVVTHYLFGHLGDRIAFVGDQAEPAWPFPDGGPDDLARYRDVTDEVVAALVREGLVRDDGVAWRDEDYPEIYQRSLALVVDLPGWVEVVRHKLVPDPLPPDP